MKRLSIVIILFLAVTLGLLILLLRPSRSVIVSDADLQVSRVPLPDGSNAFFFLSDATRAVVLSDDDGKKLATLLTTNGWDQAAAANLLAQNTEALVILQKALACPAAQVPEVTSATNDFPYLSEWKTLTSLLGIKARVLAHEGKGKEALDLAVDLVRLGHQLEDADGGTLHWLVAVAIKRSGLQRMREITATTNLDEAVLRSFSRHLEDYPVNASGLTNALKQDYARFTAMIDGIRSGSLTGTNALQHNPVVMSVMLNRERTLMLSADATRAALRAVPVPLASLSSNWFPNSPPGASWKLLLRGNAMGEIFYDMWQPILPKVIDRKCEENVDVAATRTLLALKAYKLAHGDLPESLELLIPGYLPSLPVDGFSGKPLIYSKEKKILYSVGRDLVDSGGIERDTKKNRLDSVFAIPF